MQRFFGFTLIELMLALAISALLLTLGYPTYTHYQVRAERSRAQIALMQLAAKLELYFDAHQTYAGATLQSLGAAALTQGVLYRLAIDDANAQHFLIEAIPEDQQAKHDAMCATLTLTETNQQGMSGGGDVNRCWS